MKESFIRDLIAANLNLVDPHLTLVRTEHTIKLKDGREGRIDILARDPYGCFTAIEVKKSDSSARSAAHQIFKYANLLKLKNRLSAPEIRCAIISTEWDELRYSFGEYSHFTEHESIGFKCTVNSDETIALEKVEIDYNFGGGETLPNFVFFEFRSSEGRDQALRDMVATLERIDDLNSVIIKCDYRGSSKSIINPFGFSWSILRGDPIALEESYNNLDIPIRTKAFQHIGQAWENGTFESKIRTKIIDHMPCEQYGGEPAGFALHTLNNTLQLWEVVEQIKIGPMFDVFTDDDAIGMACGFMGGHPYNFVAKVTSDRPKHLAHVRRNLDTFLSCNSRWRIAANQIFDELPSGHSLTIRIFNPMNFFGMINDIAESGASQIIPSFLIQMDGETTAVYYGCLYWTRNVEKISCSKSIKRAYGDDRIFMMRLVNQWMNEHDEKLSSLYGLTYEVTNITAAERLMISSGDAHWASAGKLRDLQTFIVHNDKLVDDVGKHCSQYGSF